MREQKGKIWDKLLQLFASANLATASYATYDAAGPVTIDTGGGYTTGKLVIDITDFDTNVGTVASGQCVDFVLRGSNLASFDGGYVPLARFRLGTKFAAESIKDAGTGGASLATSPSTGRYVIPWHNDFGGTIYRYLRLRVLFGGTFIEGITFSAFLTK